MSSVYPQNEDIGQCKSPCTVPSTCSWRHSTPRAARLDYLKFQLLPPPASHSSRLFQRELEMHPQWQRFSNCRTVTHPWNKATYQVTASNCLNGIEWNRTYQCIIHRGGYCFIRLMLHTHPEVSGVGTFFLAPAGSPSVQRCDSSTDTLRYYGFMCGKLTLKDLVCNGRSPAFKIRASSYKKANRSIFTATLSAANYYISSKARDSFV